VLREHGADRDLERRAARPPALGTEALRERDVEPEQARLAGIGRWAGDRSMSQPEA